MTDSHGAFSRRQFLGVATVAVALPSIGGEPVVPAVPDLENNVYTKLLGVRPHLGAHEHISRLGRGQRVLRRHSRVDLGRRQAGGGLGRG